ncbi:MAG: leucine-rich repeat protein, partial [Atopobiaceae bacterium]|nr:leucine-rich repeat protein [Atopobiaceae bacterium]
EGQPEAEAPAGEEPGAAATAEGAGNAPAVEYPAFKQSKTVGDVTVTVEAGAGAFPEGARLSVASVPSSRTEAAVAPERDDGENVAASYTFDIKVLGADGAELQPAGGKSVRVSFRAAEVADPNLDVSVYHVSGGEAEELSVSESGTTATATSEGFSYYTVEFTYGDLQYVLPGGGSVPLADILAAVGLQGEPTDAASSAPGLFSVEMRDGAWTVSARRAFTSTETLAVTVNGTEYAIAVTDDPGNTCGDGVTWEVSGGTLTISKTDSGTGAIWDNAFNSHDDIKNVVIEDGVTAIGNSAFASCYGLESVEIPSGVTSIGIEAFFGCTSLTSVEIPSSVTSIGDYAFAFCGSFKDVTIMSGNTTFGQGAFEACSNLKDVYYAGTQDQWNDVKSAFPGGLTVHYPCVVAVSANPTAGGTVSVSPGQSAPACPDGKYWSGTDITLTATPSGGYVFANWTEAGPSPEGGPSAEGWEQGAGGETLVSTANPYTFEVASDRELTANFEPKRKITITAASATKEYDGQPLVNTGVAVTSGSLAEGDTLVAVACGSATYTGDTSEGNNLVREGYKVMRNGVEVTGEYDIEAVAGTLTIEPSQKLLRIASADGYWAYDGQAHAKYEYTVTYGGERCYVEPADLVHHECVAQLTNGEDLVIENFKDSIAVNKGTYDNAFEYSLDHRDQYANVKVVVGKLVIYSVDSPYEVVSGEGARFVPGSGAVLPFTFKNVEDDSSTFDLFAGAEVDGTTVPKGGYTASKGSVVVELQPSFLETLSPGAHTITALFDGGGSATANFTVSAPSKHTVTFDANGHGKAPDAQEVVHGEKAKRPKDPTASGYTFGGWYADTDCKEAYDFSAPVTGDITHYAKWTAVHT